MEVFDHALNDHLENEDNTNNCMECDAPICESKSYCSRDCYNSNQI